MICWIAEGEQQSREPLPDVSALFFPLDEQHTYSAIGVVTETLLNQHYKSAQAVATLQALGGRSIDMVMSRSKV